MRALIVEDEFLSRKVLKSFLMALFDVDIVVNGREAVEAFKLAHTENKPYSLILMDIMMPEVDGIEALNRIRTMEEQESLSPKAKVIMTTALDDPQTVLKSFYDGEASAYIVKPVAKDKLYMELKKLGLLNN
ncbi:Response regulator receiver protein [Pseudodesulfovibrio profundus]|uniref:Response regulator receiver protein n=1 Tax=Pseudodesulfovibrio profundus TaxID=57320 RepID=A0A2C8FEC5_9BACT|nr:response regulator [Pseudodesulfovibrio profundus]SOB60850.1 Response regulator receiver protein [Pseudodesulfovibrio profundus]|tara:strand:- start:103055 stop:103450 length:396 start_codon:yes stop_codon:yes gene_type:complete